MFHVTFFLILYFDWLLGPHKGQNFEKHLKIFSSEIVYGMKPVLCIHVPDSKSLHNLCFLFQSDKKSGCYDSLNSAGPKGGGLGGMCTPHPHPRTNHQVYLASKNPATAT